MLHVDSDLLRKFYINFVVATSYQLVWKNSAKVRHNMADRAKWRENYPSDLDIDGSLFSDWVLLMHNSLVTDFEKRCDNHSGYRSMTWKEELGDLLCNCGIYELAVAKSVPDMTTEDLTVVYVGTTCRKRNDCSLKKRMETYLCNGSHIDTYINNALKKGFSIYGHVMTVPKGEMERMQEQSEALENRLLAEYDYAWNERNNNKKRDILKFL